jgi:hypothetical protein
LVRHTINLALALIVASSSSVRSATIRVPADQPTIQAGIDAAAIGDVVLVAPGTFTGAGNKNLNFHGKDLQVRSESGPDATIIDCEGAGRGFILLPPLSDAALIEGFTIKNGDANGGAPDGGGGMLIIGCSPTISNCILSNNRALADNQTGGGGGIVCHFSSSTIIDCVFRDNLSQRLGGGIACHDAPVDVMRCVFADNQCASINRGEGGGYCSIFTIIGPTATISHSDFVGNRARVGGGMSANVPGTLITDSSFIDNIATRLGGGLVTLGATVERCVFSGNSSGGLAGGIAAESKTRVISCVFSGNSASELGGGAYVISSIIELSVFAGNSAQTGGGIYGGGGSTAILSCTLSSNSASRSSGLFLTTGTPRVESTIIAFGLIGEAVQCTQGDPVILTCCNVYANEGGDWIGCLKDQFGVDGNISQDPLFCDVNEDFSLCADSPCAPEQSTCGLMGALGVGCGACGKTTVEPTTWGRIKALHRR